MIKLNLLPVSEKELIRLNQIQRWIVFYGSVCLCSLLIFITLLIAIWLFIFIQLKSAADNLDAARQSQQGLDLKTQQNLIKELNGKITAVSQFEKNSRHYSNLLIFLASVMPNGTKLNGLSIDEQNNLTISGHAQRREAVLDLKSALESSPLLTNVVSPLTNLTRQTDITFAFTAKLKINQPAK